MNQKDDVSQRLSQIQSSTDSDKVMSGPGADEKSTKRGSDPSNVKVHIRFENELYSSPRSNSGANETTGSSPSNSSQTSQSTSDETSSDSSTSSDSDSSKQSTEEDNDNDTNIDKQDKIETDKQETADKSMRYANFSGQGLNMVPLVIFQRTNITKLNLSGNNLCFIPPEISNLVLLKYLDISRNMLRGSAYVPGISSTGGTFRMKSVPGHGPTIGDNSKPNETLTSGKVQNIQIPNEMIELTHLETLIMMECGFSRIPEVVFDLISLKKLNLSYNLIGELPGLIGRLYQLRILYIKNMNLNTLPVQLSKCTQLRILNVFGNQILTLPDELIKLRRLITLQIDFTHCIKSVLRPRRESVSRPYNLTEARLSISPTDQEAIILNASPRKSISISDNEKEQVNEEKIILMLESGQMKSYHIPGVIYRLRKLQNLQLDHCKLNYIPTSSIRLPNLRQLNLANNYFNEIPQALYLLGDSLTHLDLSRNQFQIPVCLPSYFGSKLFNLISLKMSNVGLEIIEPNSLIAMTRLKLLDFSKNKLLTLPDEFEQMKTLEKLYLSDNKLTNLPESICSLINLSTLDLSNNQLKCLPRRLFCLKNLTTAHLYKGLSRQGMWLQGNSVLELPQRAWQSTTTRDLWTYMKNSEIKSVNHQKTTKIMVVGHPGSGKSTLIHQMIRMCTDNPKQFNIHNQINNQETKNQLKKQMKTYLDLTQFQSLGYMSRCKSQNNLNFLFFELNSAILPSDLNKHSGNELLLSHLMNPETFYFITFNLEEMVNQMQDNSFESNTVLNNIWQWICTIRTYAPKSLIKLIGTHVEFKYLIKTDDKSNSSYFSNDKEVRNSIFDYVCGSHTTRKLIPMDVVPCKHIPYTYQNWIHQQLLQLAVRYDQIMNECNFPHDMNGKLGLITKIGLFDFSKSKSSLNSNINKFRNKKILPPNLILNKSNIAYNNLYKLWNEIEIYSISSWFSYPNKVSVPIVWSNLMTNLISKYGHSVIFRFNDTTPVDSHISILDSIRLPQLTGEFFQTEEIQNLNQFLNYYHDNGCIFHFKRHSILRNIVIFNPSLFMHLCSGILSPDSMLTMSNKVNSKFLIALSNLDETDLAVRLEQINQYHCISYPLIRALVPSAGISKFKPRDKKTGLTNQPKSHMERHLSPDMKQQKLNRLAKIRKKIPRKKVIPNDVEPIDLLFNSTTKPDQLFKKIVVWLDILEVGFQLNHKHMKIEGLIIENPEDPCLVLIPVSSIRTRIRIFDNTRLSSSILLSNSDVLSNSNSIYLWFSISKLYGYFDRLIYSFCNLFSQGIQSLRFSNQYTFPHLIPHSNLNYDNLFTERQFQFVHEQFLIIIEEVRINEVIQGIRYTQSYDNEIVILNTSENFSTINLNLLEWFMSNCCRLQNEIPWVKLIWTN